VSATRLCVGLSGAFLAAILAVRGQAQSALPQGPNRDLVEQACGMCHAIETVAVNGRSEERWRATIEEMTGYGLRLSRADRALVLQYLTTYLPPK